MALMQQWLTTLADAPAAALPAPPRFPRRRADRNALERRARNDHSPGTRADDLPVIVP